MLATIKEILVNIGNFFSGVVDFVVYLVEEILKFFDMVSDAVTSIPQWYVVLPSALVSLVTGLIAAKFILRLVGRG